MLLMPAYKKKYGEKKEIKDYTVLVSLFETETNTNRWHKNNFAEDNRDISTTSPELRQTDFKVDSDNIGPTNN